MVYGGDQVRDEIDIAAVCEELSSSPAGIEASNILDAYVLMLAIIMQQNDVPQPYTPAALVFGARPHEAMGPVAL